MKISKREKFLLIFLGTLIVFYGYYQFVFLKQRERVVELKGNKAQLEEKYNHIEKVIYSLDEIKANVEDSKTRISEKTKNLYPYLDQKALIVEIDKLLWDSGIKGSMTFSEPAAEIITSTKAAEEATAESVLKPIVDSYNKIYAEEQSSSGDESTNKESPQDSTIEVLKVNLNFTGSYDSFLKLLKAFEKNEKRIFVSGLSLSQVSAEEVSGSAVLSFYSIPKITSEDKNYGKIEANGKYGKENPFTGGSVPSFSKTIEESAVNIEESYDFVIGLKSFSSDIPTFMLGKAEDNSKSTYIYEDSEKQIDAEMVLNEANGVYYYKYKTKSGSYPLNYQEMGKAFEVLGRKIIIKAFSGERLNAEDKSSVKLKVINNTDKEVLVYVKDDPSDSPRISITGEGGNVDVKRE